MKIALINAKFSVNLDAWLVGLMVNAWIVLKLDGFSKEENVKNVKKNAKNAVALLEIVLSVLRIEILVMLVSVI